MYSITFQYQHKVKNDVVLRDIEPGQSLLEVALDYSLPIPHECGGMCSCGTCHIYLAEGDGYVEFKSKREAHRLAMIKSTMITSRLACQCVLLPGNGHLLVMLPETHSSLIKKQHE